MSNWFVVIKSFTLCGESVGDTVALAYDFNKSLTKAKMNIPLAKYGNTCVITVTNKHPIDNCEVIVNISNVRAFKWDPLDKSEILEIPYESVTIVWQIVGTVYSSVINKYKK